MAHPRKEGGIVVTTIGTDLSSSVKQTYHNGKQFFKGCLISSLNTRISINDISLHLAPSLI